MKRDFTAKTQRAQRIIFFPLPLTPVKYAIAFNGARTPAKEKQCPSGRIAIFVFRPLSEKQKKKFLCVLRASAVKIGLRRVIALIY
jgi:hypothetical protein